MSALLFLPFFIVHIWLALDAADEGRGYSAILHTALTAFATVCWYYVSGVFA